MEQPDKHPVEALMDRVDSYSLSKPIQWVAKTGADGPYNVLDGPFGELRKNTVYKIGNDHFAVLLQDDIKPGHLAFDLFKKTGDGFALVQRESGADIKESHMRFIQAIEQNGATLDGATRDETSHLAQHLWDKAYGTTAPLPEQSIEIDTLNKILSGNQPKLHQNSVEYLHCSANQLPPAEMFSLGDTTTGTVIPNKEQVIHEATPHPAPPSPEPVAPLAGHVASPTNAAKAESAFDRFCREEKFLGKKGLIVAGAIVALGAAAYSFSKLRWPDKSEKTR